MIKKAVPIHDSTIEMAPVLTVQNVAEYLNVHPSTIYRLLKKRQLPAVFRTRMCRKSCGAPKWRPVRNNDRFIEHPGSTHSEHPTAARCSNACPRAGGRSRRCDFPAPIWAPFGGSSAFRYGRYTTKVPRSSASRLSEFASYGCWATSLGSTPC